MIFATGRWRERDWQELDRRRPRHRRVSSAWPSGPSIPWSSRPAAAKRVKHLEAAKRPMRRQAGKRTGEAQPQHPGLLWEHPRPGPAAHAEDAAARDLRILAQRAQLRIAEDGGDVDWPQLQALARPDGAGFLVDVHEV